MISWLIPVACVAAFLPGAAGAAVSLPAIISDHAVLQRSAETTIWGRADPDERVMVTLGSATSSTVAGADRRWRVRLDLRQMGPGPFTLLVEGRNTVTATDIVVGDVWVCSGQSNMQFRLKEEAQASREIPISANPLLRNFDAVRTATATPQEDIAGRWLVASPAESAEFTAVGYYFGKKLNAELGIPIGLVHASWGGTPIESWISAEGMAADPSLKNGMHWQKRAHDEQVRAEADFLPAYQAWQRQHGREDRPTADLLALLDPAAAGWSPVDYGRKLSEQGLPDAGAIWLRTRFTHAAGQVQERVILTLGAIGGYETVYVNGEQVWEATPTNIRFYEKRSIQVPVRLLRKDGNILAIRIFNPVGGLGVTPGVPVKLGKQTVAGPWEARQEFALPALAAAAKAAKPERPNLPSDTASMAANLYNGMIAPCTPYTITGAIWYQGESNTKRADQYRRALPILIADWRAQWRLGDFPFYLVQLPYYTAKPKIPGESRWAEMREAQAQALALPNTGMAVTIDLGEEDNIHPVDKTQVGGRLALVALARTYGKDVVHAGPVYTSMAVEDDRIRLSFREIHGGLVAKPLPATYRKVHNGPEVPLVRNSPGHELEGFTICGEDRVWAWAEARIDGDTVVVWSPAVPKPVAVRYAWAQNPTCNLYNAAGLPAGSFRTDSFPASTAGVNF